jgi:hypothetical protein
MYSGTTNGDMPIRLYPEYGVTINNEVGSLKAHNWWAPPMATETSQGPSKLL